MLLDDLKSDGPPRDATLLLSTARYWIRFRLPNSSDLLAVERECANPDQAVRVLLERCVVEAREGGAPLPPGRMAPPAVELVEAAMQANDPQADIQLSLSCPVCELGWQETFDIAGHLWEELDDWACRFLRDVHLLASTYGWCEADILAVNPRRRRAYLDLIRG
jgi:hypothetical protein